MLEETLGGVLDVVGGGGSGEDSENGVRDSAKAVREKLGYEQVSFSMIHQHLSIFMFSFLIDSFRLLSIYFLCRSKES